MKEKATLASHPSSRASQFLYYQEARSATRRVRARRNWVLVAMSAALILGIVLYLGAVRTLAQRADGGEHDWPNHGKDLANTRFQNLDSTTEWRMTFAI